MSRKRHRGVACLLAYDYKPGDPAPDGYLQWHEWAEVQHKAGLRQEQCGRCSLWRYPQELSATRDRYTLRTSRGTSVQRSSAVCLKCIAKEQVHGS